jgi:hypothetical protein
MDFLTIALYLGIIRLLIYVYFLRRDISYYKEAEARNDNLLKNQVNENKLTTEQLKNSLLRNTIFDLLLTFLQDKKTIQMKNVNKNTNPNDTVFITTTNQQGNYTQIDVFSLNMGCSVAHSII